MKNIDIKKIHTNNILDNKSINKFFKHSIFKRANLKCSLLCGDFYADPYNYYPITRNNFYTFPDQFNWQKNNSIFYENKFKDKFFKEIDSCKEISNAFVLGSSTSNNYYRNISTFLYRVYFITEKTINIAIHRNTSNYVREFIKYILDLKKIKLKKFIFLDDNFYLFKDSQIPSFFDINNVIKFYECAFPFNKNTKSNDFIYISRRNANWRNIINESDFTAHIEKEGFQIIDFETLTIKDQIRKIQSAKKIIAPHGSGLTNLVFGKTKNEVIEIVPKNIDKELMQVYLKYKKISDNKENKHYLFGADLAQNDLTRYLKTRNYGEKLSIRKSDIRKSQYFKNFIVQESEFKKLITNFSIR